MKKKSAGILIYRLTNNYLELFLVHPGGPFYTNKDLGVWSIPKGEFEDEEPKDAALREFYEETSIHLDSDLVYLGETLMKSGKTIYCWAKEKDFDASKIKSNLFDLEWPPNSGRIQSFPEMDKGDWFVIQTAISKIHPSQLFFIDELLRILNLPHNQIYPTLINPNNKPLGKEDQLDLFD